MPLLVLLCTLIGAAVLLPFLPTLIFVLLMLIGALKVLESWLTPSAPAKRGLSPTNPPPSNGAKSPQD